MNIPQRSLGCLIVLLMAISGARPGYGQAVPQPVRGSKVHVIYIALTKDSKIGPLIKVNVPQFEEMIRLQIREDRLGSLTTLAGADCTAEKILSKVNSLRLTPVDVVFVYYEGHGAYDPNTPDPDGGHYLELLDRQLPRAELIAQMRRKNPRLVVLLTDCCNVQGTVEVPQRAVAEVKTIMVTGWTPAEDLLFSYRGLVDGTASSRDEFSWFSNDVGGWFTKEFIENVYVLTGQQTPIWEDFWTRLSDETDAFFQQQKAKWNGRSPKLAAQQRMRPMAFQLEVVREEVADEPTDTRAMQIPVRVLLDP